MRIDNVSKGNIAGARESAPKGLPEGLRLGDSFEARVVRSESGSVTLRLADGQVFDARLEGETQLTAGQTVRLTVSDLGQGTVRLAQGREGDSVSLLSGLPQRPPAGDALPPALRPYAEALRQQGLPVSGENLAAMGDLVAQSPALSLRQAAFLAGNHISQEPAILTAATGLLEGGAKVGDMLAQLTASLSGPVAEGQAAPQGLAAPVAAPPDGAGQAQPAATPPPQPGGPAAAPAAQPAIAWTTLVEGVLGEALSAQPAAPPEAPAAGGMLPQASPAPPPLPESAGAIPAGPAPEAPPTAAASLTAQTGGTAAAPEAWAPAEAAPPQGSADPSRPEAAPVRSPVAQVLDQLARQSGSSPGSGKLEQFARVLETAAREMEAILALPPEQQAAGLARFVDSLSARIDRWEGDLPQMVQKAREELFARLSLVQEALTGGESSARPESAQQTQRLMDHLRLLGQIEQFTYLQLPIQQGQRQQTAEVYIYQNKKKSRRIDPENVRILLALDLEHMGHLQAFVAIRGKDVSMRLDVEQPQWADYFRSQTVALHSMLSESGYRLLENRVQVAEAAVTVETAMEALGFYEDRPVGLDFKI